MSKEELRKLWDERERLDALVHETQQKRAAAVSDDEKFDRDLECKMILKQWSTAGWNYDQAVLTYTQEQSKPLDMCAVAENLDIRAAPGR